MCLIDQKPFNNLWIFNMKSNEIKEIYNSLPENFQNALTIMQDNVNKGYFTAWSMGNEDYIVSSFWADEAVIPESTMSLNHDLSLGFHPYFDLASLTKPLFFNNFLRSYWGDDYFSFVTQSLCDFKWKHHAWNQNLLEFIQNHSELTFNSFLSHKTYFDPWIWTKFFISVRKSTEIKEDFLSLLLKHYGKQKNPKYSDLNYMFLSLLIESLFDQIDWAHEIEKLNKECSTHFFHVSIHPEMAKFAIPSYPYILCESLEHSDKSKFFGVVHDTNANLLASLPKENRIVSGHSGLYGSILDVLSGVKYLKNTQPAGIGTFVDDRFLYGLDTKNNALGHLGYTGTSFWFRNSLEQVEQKENIILLTNRTSTRTTNTLFRSHRVYIVTHMETKNTRYFMADENKVIEYYEDAFIKKLHNYFSSKQKSWNDSQIVNYYNLNEVRNKLEVEIW